MVEIEYGKAFLRHPLAKRLLMKTLEHKETDPILEQHIEHALHSVLEDVEKKLFVQKHREIRPISGKSIGYPPGFKLLAFAEFLLSKKNFNDICVPTIADMREEYNEALLQNRIWKARWVRIRGTYSFFAAIGLDRAFTFVSFFIKAWKSVN
jgi:hypothetical protein